MGIDLMSGALVAHLSINGLTAQQEQSMCHCQLQCTSLAAASCQFELLQCDGTSHSHRHFEKDTVSLAVFTESSQAVS